MVERAKKYNNKNITENLGAILKKKRIEMGYSLGDMEEMTQFPKSTILNIEKGISTNIHYYLAYGQAVELSILPFEIELKPMFELSPERKSRLFLTVKIRELLKGKGFFDVKRSVTDVLVELKTEFKIEPAKELSTNISRLLLNLVEDGVLVLAEKKGRNNLYLRGKEKI
jgi:transcriptional regulator with XRE-family HTH domain